MTRDRTRMILLVAAIVATVGDAVAYAIFIGSGLSRALPIEPDPDAVLVAPGTWLHHGLYLRSRP